MPEELPSKLLNILRTFWSSVRGLGVINSIDQNAINLWVDIIRPLTIIN